MKPMQRREWLRWAAAGLGAGALPALAQANEKRIALVIGNGAYKSAPLKNPVGDAQAVAASLKQLGYEVTLRTNTTLETLVEALREFSIRAPSAAVRTVFYAGHGIQSKGRNFLLPVDSEPQGEDEVEAKASNVGDFIDRLSALKKGLNIIVLDACRVNPFAGGVVAGPNGRFYKYRGTTPAGLAPLEAPVGTLVAFSTAPRGIALDGPAGGNSIYAKHLLTQLQKPGLPVEQLFKRVRIAVAEETKGVQVPWESSSLTTEFCFRPDPQGRCGI